jgi:hypothetical protein
MLSNFHNYRNFFGVWTICTVVEAAMNQLNSNSYHTELLDGCYRPTSFIYAHLLLLLLLLLPLGVFSLTPHRFSMYYVGLFSIRERGHYRSFRLLLFVSSVTLYLSIINHRRFLSLVRTSSFFLIFSTF